MKSEAGIDSDGPRGRLIHLNKLSMTSKEISPGKEQWLISEKTRYGKTSEIEP